MSSHAASIGLGYNKSLSQNPAELVMLSEAKHLHPLNVNQILRCAQDDMHRRRRF